MKEKGFPKIDSYNPEDKPETERTTLELPEFKGGCFSIIREEAVDAGEYGASYKLDAGYGIEFRTDSENLAKEVELARGNHEEIPRGDLTYITKMDILPARPDELPPKRMEKGQPGDLLVTPDLAHYAISGPEKFGSVISIIHGISLF